MPVGWPVWSSQRLPGHLPCAFPFLPGFHERPTHFPTARCTVAIVEQPGTPVGCSSQSMGCRSVPARPKERADLDNNKLSNVDAPSGKSGSLCHPVPNRKKGDFESAHYFPEVDKTLEQRSWGARGRVWKKKGTLREGSGQIPLLNS